MMKPYYDYELQVWVVRGIVQDCGHPAHMLACCNRRRYAGAKIAQARADFFAGQVLSVSAPAGKVA